MNSSTIEQLGTSICLDSSVQFFGGVYLAVIAGLGNSMFNT